MNPVEIAALDALDMLVVVDTTSPVPGESTIYLYPSRGSLRFRYGNTTTERPIFQTCGDGETDQDIVTRNSRTRQQVCPKDAPGRPPFRPDAPRLTRC